MSNIYIIWAIIPLGYLVVLLKGIFNPPAGQEVDPFVQLRTKRLIPFIILLAIAIGIDLLIKLPLEEILFGYEVEVTLARFFTYPVMLVVYGTLTQRQIDKKEHAEQQEKLKERRKLLGHKD